MAIKFTNYIPVTVNNVLRKMPVIDVGNFTTDQYLFGEYSSNLTPDFVNEMLSFDVVASATVAFRFNDGIDDRNISFTFGNTIREFTDFVQSALTLNFYNYSIMRNDTIGFGGFNFPLDRKLYVCGIRIVKDKSTGTFPEDYLFNRIFLATFIWSNDRWILATPNVYNGRITDKTFYNFPSELEKAGKIPIDDSGTQDPGGDGPGDFPDEPVDDDGLPDEVITYCKLFSIYNPSTVTLSTISDWLNSGSFLDAWTHKADAINSVVSLHSIPIPPAKLSKAPSTFKIGGKAPEDVPGASSISCPVVTAQYYDVDLGSVSVPNVVGYFADYAPYFKLQLYCPMYGTVELMADDFVGDVVKLHYKIDVVTGDFVGQISNSSKILHIIKGNCATKYPLTSTDYSQIYTTALNVASNISTAKTPGAIAQSIPDMLSLSQMKPTYNYAGGLSGSGGIMSILRPYLIVHRPTVSYPRDFEKFRGYASNITAKLSTLKGFTKVKHIHLDNVICTEEERSELLSLLQKGVIF